MRLAGGFFHSKLRCDALGASATIRSPGPTPLAFPKPVAVRDATSEYRKLVAALAARAARLGSRDAESAAQEALKRSLANPVSRAAIEYYFHERRPAAVSAPAWPLDQLLAWLHGVLRFVVSEERARVTITARRRLAISTRSRCV